jgi:hypothetical protein
MSTRPRVTAAEKEKVMAGGVCYVCSDLSLPHAGFEGYDKRHVHLDHYLAPFSTAAGKTAPTLPIHAAPNGATPDQVGFESASVRNCHKGKSDDFSSRNEFVQYVRAVMASRGAGYVDDIYGNGDRDPSDSQFSLPVAWSAGTATFRGSDYPVVREVRPSGFEWSRFLTALEPGLLFTDRTSQVRPAKKKALHTMMRTFLIDAFPMFAPVNARVDGCGHVVIFDGNHRATAFALAFGLDEPMPIMIWQIADEGVCALLEDPPQPEGEGDDADLEIRE